MAAGGRARCPTTAQCSANVSQMIILWSPGVILARGHGLGRSSDDHSRSASDLLAAILNQKRPLGSQEREPSGSFSMASDGGLHRWPFSSIGARTPDSKCRVGSLTIQLRTTLRTMLTHTKHSPA